MRSLFHVSGRGSLSEMQQRAYDNEDRIQRLLAEHLLFSGDSDRLGRLITFTSTKTRSPPQLRVKRSPASRAGRFLMSIAGSPQDGTAESLPMPGGRTGTRGSWPYRFSIRPNFGSVPGHIWFALHTHEKRLRYKIPERGR